MVVHAWNARTRPILTAFTGLVALLLLAGCGGPKQVQQPPPVDQPEEVEAPSEPEYPQVTVVVPKENLRDAPNGAKVGEAVQGATFDLYERRGNWARISHPERDYVWIWTPSLGMDRVNVIDLTLLLGREEGIRRTDDLLAVLGEPTDTKKEGMGVSRWIYQNMLPGKDMLFGTRKFQMLGLLVDESGGTVLQADITLAPYEGDVDGLLSLIGLPDKHPTKSGFDEVLFRNVYRGLYEVILTRRSGDLTKFEMVQAWKYNPERWMKQVVVNDRRAVNENGTLSVVLDVENTDDELSYSSPMVSVQMRRAGRELGRWQLGPAELHLSPGEVGEIRFALPLDPSSVNLATVELKAEISHMFVVPTTGGLP
ncbi:hypothetical protein GF324_10795 [bacterium]|nr:hypothetical protein [bacterium]